MTTDKDLKKATQIDPPATMGTVRRKTTLIDKIWIGVRETDKPYLTHNLFISLVDRDFVKDEPIAWDDDLVYFKKETFKILQKSTGVVPTIVPFPSFRP